MTPGARVAGMRGSWPGGTRMRLPAWWPEGNPLLPASPALHILVFPGLFRFT